MKPPFILLFFLIYNAVIAQEWTRMFTSDTYLYGHDLSETYDGGYYIVARNDLYPERIHAALIKTDINGYKRWECMFGISGKGNNLIINSICTVPGDGWLMTGSFIDSLSNSSPAFMKINYCAEPEWCRIYHSAGLYLHGVQSVKISDGYLGLVQYNDVVPKNKIALYRLDNTGNLIWSVWIVPSDSAISYVRGHEIQALSDQTFLITGDCHYYTAGDQRTVTYHPLLIKIDPDGNILWATPWGVTQNFDGEVTLCSRASSSGLFYSPVTNRRTAFPFGNKPAFIRTRIDGSEAGYVNLMGMSDLSRATCLNFMDSNTIFTAATWGKLDGTHIMGVIKTDTNGGEKSTREFFPSLNTPTKAINTLYGKYLLMASTYLPNDSIGVILWKLNKDLTFDSVYTKPRTYDSLCGTVILSDTIEAQCDSSVITVNTEDFSSHGALTIFPVPATGSLTIRIPAMIQLNRVQNQYQHTKFLYHWKSVQLEVLNTTGMVVLRRKVLFDEKSVRLETSGWQRGVYLIRLTMDGYPAGQGKCILW